jgi:ACS family glucarate transporter-like MFS transporter
VIASLIGLVGWRLSFVLTGPLGFLMAAWWWRYSRDRPEEHPEVDAAELALINEGRSAEHHGAAAKTGWWLVLRDRNVLLLTASYFLSNYVFYFFFNWLYIYLVEVRKFAALSGGALAAAPWIIGAVGAGLGGMTCDRLSRRLGIRRGTRIVSMTGLTLAGCFILAAATAQSPYVAVVWLSLCLASQQFTDSAYWAATTSVGGRNAGAACGVLNTGGNAVGGVGALLVPYTAERLGWAAALGSATGFALAGALLWCWIQADRPPSEPARVREPLMAPPGPPEQRDRSAAPM